MKALALMLAPALAGCALFSSIREVSVREVAQSPYCNTAGKSVQVSLLPDAGTVVSLQALRGIALLDDESPGEGPFALVEMGVRPTGGYRIEVSKTALVRGDHVSLEATFYAPRGGLQTQALSSPCVLVALPPGSYAKVEVRDSSGVVRAQSSAPPQDAEPAQ